MLQARAGERSIGEVADPMEVVCRRLLRHLKGG